jgi:hypothetical protein
LSFFPSEPVVPDQDFGDRIPGERKERVVGVNHGMSGEFSAMVMPGCAAVSDAQSNSACCNSAGNLRLLVR